MRRSADIRRAGSVGSLVLLAIAAAVVCLPPPVTHLSAQQAQQPGFNAVYVTATVVDKDGQLVTDLTRDDFEIGDNGVVRDITIFRNDAVPFSVVIMLDISGSMVDNLTVMQRAVAEFIRRFEPGDRATIGTFAGMPEISPRFTANQQTLLGRVNTSLGGTGTLCTQHVNPRVPLGAGGTALWDGIECGIGAFGSDSETPRRIVMVVSDGEDNVSASTPLDVVRDADRYGVMIYAVSMPGIGKSSGGELRLQGVAEESGGGYFRLTGRNDLVSTFARIAEELRHQYVFGFAESASDAGHHDLQVRARRPDVTTRARRVYLDAAPAAGPLASRGQEASKPPAPPPDATDAAGRLSPSTTDTRGRAAAAEALDRYARGDLTIATSPRVLGSEFSDLQRAAPDWIRAGGAGNESRRRLTAATYVLERLSQIYDIALWHPGQEAPIALEWACSLLRETPPLPEERVWHEASVALLERGGAAATLLEHLDHAERRFPAETRWALARAVAEEMAMWPEPRDDRPFSIPNAVSFRFTQAVTRAAALEPVRSEAHLRWGYYELRRGRIDAALSHFNEAGSPTDAFVSYWLHLFTGRALERANRSAEAIGAYQLAFAVAPFAQAATVALSAALVEGHRSAESTSLVTRLLELQSPAIDPWEMYPAPEWRFYPSWIDELRMAVSRQPW